MPLEVYDVDGNPIEGVLAPEEVQEIKDKLAKLENKDFNFRRLEQMTEEEKGKLTSAEIAYNKKISELEDKEKNFTEKFIGDIKKDALDKFVGDDEDLRKKVEHHMSRIKDSETAQSRAEIEQLVNEALLLSTGGRARNPINAALNVSGDAPVRAKSNKLSDDARELASKLGLNDEDLKKFN
jgi:hypothetical protein